MAENMKLENTSDVLLYTDIDAIEDQIKVRYSLINQMVGQLYPSILADQAVRLQVRVQELKNANRYSGR